MLEKKGDQANQFHIDKAIVVIHFPSEEDENIVAKADVMIRQGLRCADVTVVRAKRMNRTEDQVAKS